MYDSNAEGERIDSMNLIFNMLNIFSLKLEFLCKCLLICIHIYSLFCSVTFHIKGLVFHFFFFVTVNRNMLTSYIDMFLKILLISYFSKILYLDQKKQRDYE